MKKAFSFSVLLVLIFLFMIFFQFNCVQQQGEKTMSKEAQIERGKFLVMIGDCNICHSPKVFTDMGPMIDSTKFLSGYQAGSPLPPLSELAGVKNWVSASGDLQTWVGPWGVSFPANLTPDEVSGIGTWTADVFIKAMRTGKHMGVGRPILPPMPFENLARLNDNDLKAIFAYLKSLKPIRNKVPDPISPSEVASLMKKSK